MTVVLPRISAILLRIHHSCTHSVARRDAALVPLLAAAAATYDSISESLWAARVDGSSRVGFADNTAGFSTGPVRDHVEALGASNPYLQGER